jgi:hypothetical protein
MGWTDNVFKTFFNGKRIKNKKTPAPPRRPPAKDAKRQWSLVDAILGVVTALIVGAIVVGAHCRGA